MASPAAILSTAVPGAGLNSGVGSTTTGMGSTISTNLARLKTKLTFERALVIVACVLALTGIIVAAIALAKGSSEGPEGPMGPVGPIGPAGPPGPDQTRTSVPVPAPAGILRRVV